MLQDGRGPHLRKATPAIPAWSGMRPAPDLLTPYPGVPVPGVEATLIELVRLRPTVRHARDSAAGPHRRQLFALPSASSSTSRTKSASAFYRTIGGRASALAAATTRVRRAALPRLLRLGTRWLLEHASQPRLDFWLGDWIVYAGVRPRRNPSFPDRHRDRTFQGTSM